MLWPLSWLVECFCELSLRPFRKNLADWRVNRPGPFGTQALPAFFCARSLDFACFVFSMSCFFSRPDIRQQVFCSLIRKILTDHAVAARSTLQKKTWFKAKCAFQWLLSIHLPFHLPAFLTSLPLPFLNLSLPCRASTGSSSLFRALYRKLSARSVCSSGNSSVFTLSNVLSVLIQLCGNSSFLENAALHLEGDDVVTNHTLKATTFSSRVFFARCCLGMFRADRPSVSEVKVKITAWVSGHHISKHMEVYSKRINKNMQKQQREDKNS